MEVQMEHVIFNQEEFATTVTEMAKKLVSPSL